MATNIAIIGGVGRVIFDQDGPANLLSLTKMGKMYRITFDTGKVTLLTSTRLTEAKQILDSIPAVSTTMTPQLDTNTNQVTR